MDTPKQLEQKRLDEANTSKLKLDLAGNNTVDAKQIENASPSELRAIGIAKLPLLLLTIGNQVKNIINPSIEKLIQQFVDKFKLDNICPTPAQVQSLLNQRNNIVTQLNRVSKTLNIITVTLTGVSTFLNLLQAAIKAIDVSIIAAKIAALVSPPLLATLPTTLNTLNQSKSKILIDEKGNARLVKIQAIIGGASLVSSIIGGYILKSVTLLKSIDALIKECDPTLIENNLTPTENNSLIPISKETQDIADAQLQAEVSQNETTYNGFIIEIEEVPYTPTVIRKRAIGKNVQGIKLIQTELSFTTDDQTLINELKLIIDRDNLKAY